MRIGISQETKEDVEFGDNSSRRILVCGKTGSGKSYSMGVILEELAERNDIIPIVIDPQGSFWTMARPNVKQEMSLYEWGLTPRGYRVNLLVPGNPVEMYGDERIVQRLTDFGLKVSSIRINPYDLSEEMWCDLFDLDINDLRGSLMYRAVKSARAKNQKNMMIPDIRKEVEKQNENDATIKAVLRRLDIAEGWGIFETIEYHEIEEVFDPTSINIIDVSVLDQSRYGLRNLIVAVIARFLFNKRAKSRRLEELSIESEMKKVWLAIDEAHNFCPSGKSSLSKEILVRWAKEGRQPGLSLIVASQQPSALDNEILSQCDIRLIHKLTNREDIKAINALSENYIGQEIEFFMKQLSHVGEAIMIDDQKERIQILSVRPRKSDHGGGGA